MPQRRKGEKEKIVIVPCRAEVFGKFLFPVWLLLPRNSVMGEGRFAATGLSGQKTMEFENVEVLFLGLATKSRARLNL